MPYLSLSPATVPLFHIRLGVRLEGRHPALRRTGIDNDRLARNRAGVVRRLEERNVEPSSSLLEIPRKRTTSRASRVMPRRSLSRRTEIGEFLPGVVSHDGGHQIFPGVPESFGTQSVVSPFGSRTAELVHGCLSGDPGHEPATFGDVAFWHALAPRRPPSAAGHRAFPIVLRGPDPGYSHRGRRQGGRPTLSA
jgi:hypothetical protein